MVCSYLETDHEVLESSDFTIDTSTTSFFLEVAKEEAIKKELEMSGWKFNDEAEEENLAPKERTSKCLMFFYILLPVAE